MINRIASVTLCLSLLGLSGLAKATPFTAGNILISEGAFSDSTRKIFEYTRTGTLVQSILIPRLAGQDSFDSSRGMVVDSLGNLHVFNGVGTIGMSNYNPVTSIWTSTMVPEDSIINNGSYGKIASFGNFVFMPKHGTSQILRYNTTNGTRTAFATGDDPIDFAMGSDGLLYSLEGSGIPSGDSLRAYNPTTMALSITSFSAEKLSA